MSKMNKNASESGARLIPTAVRHLRESRELEIEFGPYFRSQWPIDSLQMLCRGEAGWQPLPMPTEEQLSEVIIWEGKDVVEFPAIDQHLSIAALLRGQLGSKRWMRQLLVAARRLRLKMR